MKDDKVFVTRPLVKFFITFSCKLANVASTCVLLKEILFDHGVEKFQNRTL